MKHVAVVERFIFAAAVHGHQDAFGLLDHWHGGRPGVQPGERGAGEKLLRGGPCPHCPEGLPLRAQNNSPLPGTLGAQPQRRKPGGFGGTAGVRGQG